jgi:hypothetical protein
MVVPVGQETVVLDSGGQWLSSVRSKLERLEAPYLRTIVTQCPAASPLALQEFVEKQGRQKVAAGWA